MKDPLGLAVAVRSKTLTVYTIYSVNKITGDSRPISTKQYKPQGRHGSGAADLPSNSNTPGERNGIRTGILTSIQHNFSGEQGRDPTTLSNHRTPSGQHGSGTAGFSTNSGTPGFSTNSTQGGGAMGSERGSQLYIDGLSYPSRGSLASWGDKGGIQRTSLTTTRHHGNTGAGRRASRPTAGRPASQLTAIRSRGN